MQSELVGFQQRLERSLEGLKEGDRKNITQCIVNLLQDSLNLRKIQLVGSKMRIYQERLRKTNIGSIMQEFKQSQDGEVFQTEDSQRILEACEKVARKT